MKKKIKTIDSSKVARDAGINPEEFNTFLREHDLGIYNYGWRAIPEDEVQDILEKYQNR